MPRKKKQDLSLPETTKVELILLKGEYCYKYVRTLAEAKIIISKLKKGWNWYLYQVGFSQYKNAIEK